MFLSEIYEITDCLFYDDAVTGRVNSDWVNSLNRLTITVDDEGTLLEAPSDLNGYYMSNLPNTSSGSVPNTKEWNVPLVLECDVVDYSKKVSGDGMTGFWFNDTRDIGISFDGKITVGDHLKLEIDGISAKLYINNSSTPISSSLNLTNPFNVGFRVRAGSTLKFKNFKIYLP